MDIGFGYDSEDSFVDDSEAVCNLMVWMSCRSLEPFCALKLL